MVSYSYYRARLRYYSTYRNGCDGNNAEFRPFYGGDRFYDHITGNKSRSVANKNYYTRILSVYSNGFGYNCR